MRRGDRAEVFCCFLIWNALPGRPPSRFDFQPHGSVSPETLFEKNITILSCSFSVASSGLDITNRDMIGVRTYIIRRILQFIIDTRKLD